MHDSSDNMALHLETQKSAEELLSRLREFQPWGHKITFSNGVSTEDLERRVPFNEYTLNKVKTIEENIPIDEMRGGNVLDIGSNTGHNSIYVASRYTMTPTGIDISQRHLDVANMLSEMAGISGNYIMANAETYVEAEHFDLVLHFGTLYHLPNPLQALQSSWQNLKPGGYLALETQCYDHEDPNVCYFMHMHNNDKSNFWALSMHVIQTWLKLLGFIEIQILRTVKMEFLGPDMSGVILIARKPSVSGKT